MRGSLLKSPARKVSNGAGLAGAGLGAVLEEELEAAVVGFVLVLLDADGWWVGVVAVVTSTLGAQPERSTKVSKVTTEYRT